MGRGRDYCVPSESADRKLKTHESPFVALGSRDVTAVKNGEVRGSRHVPDGRVTDACPS